MKKRRRIKWKNVIIMIIILVSIITLITSIIKIIQWNINCNNIKKLIRNIEDITEVKETSSIKAETINIEEEIPKENYYWDYIKMNMIDVNFNKLKKTNSDVKGWIKVNGTNINYPFVQSKNNKYYLTHSFNKSYNKAGWIFLDYRNNLTNNKHTIIYGHGRTDKTMFGSLKNILSSDWLDDYSNYIVKISTEKENTLWQVFSIYHIPTTNDYLQVNFIDDDEFFEFANILKNRSVHDFNTNIAKNDNILTLSTCYNKNEKMVLHAKLIKKEKKY